MVIRTVKKDEKDQYNHVVTHPLQSWEWGEFRKKTDVAVIRHGRFEKKKLLDGFQLTIHHLPLVPYTVGYLPKGPMPDVVMLETLAQVGQKNKCIFIKLEPNEESSNYESRITNHELQIGRYKLLQSPHPLFPKYSFQIDLTKSEGELLKQMHQKTRYNIRLAQRKGVVIEEDNSNEAFDVYLKLTFETTKRQEFYAHDENYHRLMWQTIGAVGHHNPQSNRSGNPTPTTPIAHLLTAKYKGQILVAWILFLFNDVLYYPYGASSAKHRNLMASNLIMWEAMRWGKKHGAKCFDLWGALGPDPDKSDPWYGFHKFKQGYGPKLIEFVGSYDLILNPLLYRVYNIANTFRWFMLQRR